MNPQTPPPADLPPSHTPPPLAPPEPSAQVPPEEPLPDNPDTKCLLEALLRRPQALVPRLVDGANGASGRFLLVAVVSFMLFGLVLGCFAKQEQLWAAPLKITAGLLFAGVICFPSLYIFATLAGARVTITQLAACLSGALALAGLLLLGFAPAVWIFAESTDSFGFMGALAVVSWLIAVVFATRFLKTAMSATGSTEEGPLVIWSLIFLLVTLQMTTSLRPILGRSDEFLTSEKKFFLQHWGDTMGDNLPPRTAPPETSPVKKPR
jgi:hypothetical protein